MPSTQQSGAFEQFKLGRQIAKLLCTKQLEDTFVELYISHYIVHYNTHIHWCVLLHVLNIPALTLSSKSAFIYANIHCMIVDAWVYTCILMSVGEYTLKLKYCKYYHLLGLCIYLCWYTVNINNCVGLFTYTDIQCLLVYIRVYQIRPLFIPSFS